MLIFFPDSPPSILYKPNKRASKQAAVLLVIFLGFIFVLQSNLGFLWPPMIHITDAYVVGRWQIKKSDAFSRISPSGYGRGVHKWVKYDYQPVGERKWLEFDEG